MATTAIQIPLKTTNPLNRRRHWRHVAKEAKEVRGWTFAMCRRRVRALAAGARASITLTRLSPGLLDDDNLAATLKAVRDGVADALGCDDGPKGPLKFHYNQRRAVLYAVLIEIEET